MKVVLLKSIDKLGSIGETRDVALGFARNYLMPKGLAALPGDPKALEAKKARSHKAKHEKPTPDDMVVKKSKSEKRLERQEEKKQKDLGSKK